MAFGTGVERELPVARERDGTGGAEMERWELADVKSSEED